MQYKYLVYICSRWKTGNTITSYGFHQSHIIFILHTNVETESTQFSRNHIHCSWKQLHVFIKKKPSTLFLQKVLPF